MDAYYELPEPVLAVLWYIWKTIRVIGSGMITLLGVITVGALLGFFPDPPRPGTETLLAVPGGAVPVISVPLGVGGEVLVSNWSTKPVVISVPKGSDNAGMSRTIEPGKGVVFSAEQVR